MNAPQTPLVSVVTPCYNSAAHVAETIASVRAQTYANIEHIVVDDCSTDGSWEIISAHGDHVTGVRLAENRGGCHARNRGASMARGAFLMFLDADDTISADTIGALVEASKQRPGAIVFVDWMRLRSVGGSWRVTPREVALPAPGSDPLAGWLEGIWVPPCAILWPRAVFERTGGWDETVLVNQDGDLMMRALAAGVALTAATGGTAYYREHGGERLTVSGSTFTVAQTQSLIRVLEKLSADLERRGTFDRYAESLGVAYQRLALAAARNGHYEIAREYGARGVQYAGRRAISRTRPGRLLTWLIGVERKERLVTALARRGIATNARKQTLRLRDGHDANAGKGTS